MRIKRVEADSVAEAMRELRLELGDHALILHTKYLAPRGLTGWFKTPRVEILGAIDEPEVFSVTAGAGAAAAARALAGDAGQASRGATPPATASLGTAHHAAASASLTAADAEPAAARTKGKKSRRAQTTRRPEAPVPLTELVPGLATAVPGPVGAPAADLGGIRLATPDFSRAGRRPRRIAFVGPTGAGKTTTLAKLAARAQLEHGRRVGLVTIDTYRIGAVPQLRAYAEILGVPLEVASTPEELSHALARLADCDVVFIDTIGRSPLAGGVDGLVPFMAIAGADEIHLVLAATTRPQDSLRAARSFARLVPNRLVVTKIDETEDHETVGTIARATGLPLAWLGTGQEVPDDIEQATAERIAVLA
jgi:flagellar biosynthesis protein FlhF